MSGRSLHILLADDDRDDRFFFQNALDEFPIKTTLTTIEDGERLMNYLGRNCGKLPDVLFLDLNMPRRNGSECVKEIKRQKKFRNLPIIIYSTSLHQAVADELYRSGAHYYVRKGGLNELTAAIHLVLRMLVEGDFVRPKRDKFILESVAM